MIAAKTDISSSQMTTNGQGTWRLAKENPFCKGWKIADVFLLLAKGVDVLTLLQKLRTAIDRPKYEIQIRDVTF